MRHTEETEAITHILQKIRSERGLSGRQVATQTNARPSTYAAYEAGDRVIPYSYLSTYIKTMNVCRTEARFLLHAWFASGKVRIDMMSLGDVEREVTSEFLITAMRADSEDMHTLREAIKVSDINL